MTDTEIKRRKAICEVAGVKEIENVSDGFHTFKQLYYQRMMLFAALVKQNRDKAWKSLRHEDGELCFGGGWFVVGIDTPEGSYTYHYEDKYFDLFDCEDLERGKVWDGHTEEDVTRLLSLEREPCDDCISRQAVKEQMIKYGFHASDMTVTEFAEDLPSVKPQEPKVGWIPVSERLPEDETDVLVCNKDGEIELTSGSRSTEVDDFIWYTSGWRFGDVVAWMSLPAPYEPQESKEENDGRYGI